MKILEFAGEFPDESSCRSDFKDKREQEGIICKKCKSEQHYWLKSKEQWECKSCHFRTTLRSGSMMENSNLPVRMWYLAMAFMSYSKKGLSAKELQRQLEHSRYDTVCRLCTESGTLWETEIIYTHLRAW